MYISKYTDFTAYEKPLTHEIYFKHGNETIIIIYIDDEWNMHGTVQHPEYLTIGFKKMTLNQKECEQLLLRNMPPKGRIKTIKSMGLDKYDSAEMLYRTRGITLLDDSWFAWSDSDKIEDYHPLKNDELMHERGLMDIAVEGEVLPKAKPVWEYKLPEIGLYTDKEENNNGMLGI